MKPLEVLSANKNKYDCEKQKIEFYSNEMKWQRYASL